MAAIRIILADDHDIFRAGLKSLLDKDIGFNVVAQAKDGEELLEQMRHVKADCVVLDLSMPNMDGLQALTNMRKKFPRVKVLVLTMHKDQEHFKRAMAHGAQGYLLKDNAFDLLVTGINMVMKGKTFVSPGMTQMMAEQYMHSLELVNDPLLGILTGREKEILRLIAQGFANKNIAVKLGISIRTVETHRSRLIRKLGLKTTAALVKYALSKGLA